MQKTNRFFSTVLFAGFIAGTLDAIAAIGGTLVFAHNNPVRIFWFIASGVFGKKASPPMLMTASFFTQFIYAFLGVCFHYLIAYIFTLFFFLIYPKIKILSKNRVITGLAYGLFVWLIMNLIVVPITYSSKPSFNIFPSTRGIIYLMLAIGLPLSFIAYKYYYKRAL